MENRENREKRGMSYLEGGGMDGFGKRTGGGSE